MQISRETNTLQWLCSSSQCSGWLYLSIESGRWLCYAGARQAKASPLFSYSRHGKFDSQNSAGVPHGINCYVTDISSAMMGGPDHRIDGRTTSYKSWRRARKEISLNGSGSHRFCLPVVAIMPQQKANKRSEPGGIEARSRLRRRRIAWLSAIFLQESIWLL